MSDTTIQMIALLDGDAPAKQVQPVLREPDMIDDGQVYWFGGRSGSEYAVSVPLERVGDFDAYMRSVGLSVLGRDSFRIDEVGVYPSESTIYDALKEAVR